MDLPHPQLQPWDLTLLYPYRSHKEPDLPAVSQSPRHHHSFAPDPFGLQCYPPPVAAWAGDQAVGALAGPTGEY